MSIRMHRVWLGWMVFAGLLMPALALAAGAWALPAGSTVTVRSVLTLPTGKARVYIQDGKVVRRSHIDHFRVYCSLGLRRLGDEPLVREIRPGDFTTGTARGHGYAQREAGPVRAVAYDFADVRRDGGGLGRITYATEIPLHSSEQRQVDDLTCAYDTDPAAIHTYPGVDEMQAALGGLVTIRPAAERGD